MLGVSMRLPEQLDLATPLRAYIQSNYSEAELQSVLPAISASSALRARIHQSIVRNDADSDAVVQAFLQYYAHLCALQQHFPFGNTPPPSSMLGLRAVKVPTVRCQFTWFDSFRHTQRVSDYDVSFELHSVLFDTAALYSRRATSTKGQATAADDSPIKEACRLFQMSAGLFDHLQRSAGVDGCQRPLGGPVHGGPGHADQAHAGAGAGLLLREVHVRRVAQARGQARHGRVGAVQGRARASAPSDA